MSKKWQNFHICFPLLDCREKKCIYNVETLTFQITWQAGQHFLFYTYGKKNNLKKKKKSAKNTVLRQDTGRFFGLFYISFYLLYWNQQPFLYQVANFSFEI